MLKITKIKGLRFLKCFEGGARQFMKIRRANIQHTTIIWITEDLKYDKYLGEFYNPKTPILIFLN